ncbi:hypothetical protein K431DRAFT_305659 [Polychaeton citri CBS 116435]|uniref:Heat shock factor binding protein 1 n=1 Tax=Polychaeton citri CBS 116435 TaxID=1314669 RepID=A0A9P4Q1M0_9PEZI|nr:hypothetical protein K431DRAFT_305659 [Polychaeton citri CBS 116435]
MSDRDSTFSATLNKLSLSDDNASTDGTPPSELVAVVDDLLNQLSSKFSSLSSEMITKMDEMSRRLDNLEATIQASNAQAESNQTGE